MATKQKQILNATSSLKIIFWFFILSWILLLPKIYLANNIYYVSKDINKLNAQYLSLKEENKFLQQQLEKMKYHNQIMDSLILEQLNQK